MQKLTARAGWRWCVTGERPRAEGWPSFRGCTSYSPDCHGSSPCSPGSPARPHQNRLWPWSPPARAPSAGARSAGSRRCHWPGSGIRPRKRCGMGRPKCLACTDAPRCRRQACPRSYGSALAVAGIDQWWAAGSNRFMGDYFTWWALTNHSIIFTASHTNALFWKLSQINILSKVLNRITDDIDHFCYRTITLKLNTIFL